MAGLAFTGCTSTRTLETWMAEAVTPQLNAGEVAIFSLHPRLDLRKAQPEQLAAQLQSEGVQAAPFSEILPPDVPLDKETRDSVLREVRSAGIGQALVLRPVKNETNTSYIGYGTPLYFAGQAAVPVPITTVQQITEVNLYDTAEEKLLWSGQFLTPQNGTAKVIARDLASRVVQEMSDQGLL